MNSAVDLQAVAAGVDDNAGGQLDGVEVPVEIAEQLLGDPIIGEIEFSRGLGVESWGGLQFIWPRPLPGPRRPLPGVPAGIVPAPVVR